MGRDVGVRAARTGVSVMLHPFGARRGPGNRRGLEPRNYARGRTPHKSTKALHLIAYGPLGGRPLLSQVASCVMRPPGDCQDFVHAPDAPCTGRQVPSVGEVGIALRLMLLVSNSRPDVDHGLTATIDFTRPAVCSMRTCDAGSSCAAR